MVTQKRCPRYLGNILLKDSWKGGWRERESRQKREKMKRTESDVMKLNLYCEWLIISNISPLTTKPFFLLRFSNVQYVNYNLETQLCFVKQNYQHWRPQTPTQTLLSVSECWITRSIVVMPTLLMHIWSEYLSPSTTFHYSSGWTSPCLSPVALIIRGNPRCHLKYHGITLQTWPFTIDCLILTREFDPESTVNLHNGIHFSSPSGKANIFSIFFFFCPCPTASLSLDSIFFGNPSVHPQDKGRTSPPAGNVRNCL